MYTGTGVAARRYQQKYRNQLWHSDIKYGPYLPIGKEGKKKQVYLVTFVDDATRFILHGEFYPVLDQIIVEDCFKKAILKYGVPEKVYFDNGGQYRNKWMNRACAKMGIRLLFAKPYSPPKPLAKLNVLTGWLTHFSRGQIRGTTNLRQIKSVVHSLAGGMLPAQASFRNRG